MNRQAIQGKGSANWWTYLPEGLLVLAVLFINGEKYGRRTHIDEATILVSALIAAAFMVASAMFLIGAKRDTFKPALLWATAFLAVCVVGVFDDHLQLGGQGRYDRGVYLFPYLWMITGGFSVMGFVRATLMR